ncbi:MAG: hypothetical protein ACOCTN_01535 [Candidatus Natronoplasma sp.]
MGVRRALLLVFTIMMISVISTAAAHVPRNAAENESLETAMVIEDPIKSWAIYSELRHGEVANYYEMEMKEGERLYLSLMLPDNDDFVPNIAVIGPGIKETDDVPGFLEIPEDVGVNVIEGELGERDYEPFTPGSYYHPARFDEEIDESETYYVVVYNEEETGGKYGLAVGYQETWGPMEWIGVPFDVIQIRIWEGQSIVMIFAPMISVLGAGFAWTAWKKKENKKVPNNVNERGLLISSLLYIGSGAMVVMQMIIASVRSNPGLAVIVTTIFALIPLILGYKLWQKSLDFKKPNRWSRIKVIIYGVVGFFVWAGIIIGPVIAIISGLLPSKDV